MVGSILRVAEGPRLACKTPGMVLSTMSNMSLTTATIAGKRSHSLRYTWCAVCGGSSSPKHGWHTGAAPHRKCAGWCRQWDTRHGRSPPQTPVGARPAPAAPHWPSATRHPDAFAHRPAGTVKLLLLLIQGLSAVPGTARRGTHRAKSGTHSMLCSPPSTHMLMSIARPMLSGLLRCSPRSLFIWGALCNIILYVPPKMKQMLCVLRM